MKFNFKQLQRYCFPAGLVLGFVIGMVTGQTQFSLAIGALIGLVLHFIAGYFGLNQ